MIRVSASSLARVEKCPASASLPRIGQIHADAEAGTAEHADLELAHPEGAELAYALDPVTGRARYLGQGLKRGYHVDWDNEIPGTADHVEVEAERVVVTDHKTGFGYMVAPAAKNLQLAHNALCAADVNGKSAALVQIHRTGTGHVEQAELDTFDLLAAKARIAAIWAAAKAPNPKVATGDHCWRCECIVNCPAHLTMAVAFTEGVWPNVMPSDGLTTERVAQGWEYLKNAKRILGLVERTYRAFASQWPVPLADGKVLGERVKEVEALDGPVTFQILRDLHGDEVARAAVGMETSKSALEEALKPIAPKGKRAGMVRDALAAIGAANGVKTTSRRVVEEFQPKEE